MPTIDLAGRELWALQEGGRLQHSALSACAGAASATPGGPVALMPCEGADKWEPLGNGQLRAGRFCLSQSGQAAGSADAASKSAVVATSTSHPSAHGAWAAVDSDESSYWASKRDEAEPVSLTVDLGGVHALDAERWRRVAARGGERRPPRERVRPPPDQRRGRVERGAVVLEETEQGAAEVDRAAAVGANAGGDDVGAGEEEERVRAEPA